MPRKTVAKKRNPKAQDATLINVNALKRRIVSLELRITALELRLSKR